MTVAIYVRLSLEDDDLFDGKEESASITNQRDLLMNHIQNDPELCHSTVVEYSDDGYSGKNFDRPGVQELLEAARNGTIDCILVKDISRFGRDYITVGNYITRVFPFLGVRFIALNDQFDSTRKGDLDRLDVSFQSLIYDMYSRDLSQKVRSAKARLASQGVYINPVAPYGYIRSPKDKHTLIPDPKTADTVRRIFQMAASGISIEKITRALNQEGVPPPSRAKAGTSSEHANWSNQYWQRNAVYWILRDRQYIGSNVFGKRTRRQVGVRKALTARQEDWFVVDDRHEPLVSKELFQRAQEQLGVYKQIPHGKSNNLLSRKVYCGVCNYAIIRRGTKNKYYCCSRPRTVPGLGCCQEKIYEQDIMEMVVKAIRVQARYAVELNRIAESQRKDREKQAVSLRDKLRHLKELKEQIAVRLQTLYESYVEGNISRDTYVQRKAVILAHQGDICRARSETEEALLQLETARSIFVEKYLSYAELDSLTAEAASDLLDRVTIWPGGRLDISLNYLDDIPRVLAVEHDNTT